MAGSPESESSASSIWIDYPLSNPDFEEYTLEERCKDLFDFLADAPIASIHMNSIIPIKGGAMYLLTLVTVEYDDTGNVTFGEHFTDNQTIDFLAEKIDRMESKERRTYANVVTNIETIRALTTNPVKWSNPIDKRTDH